MEMVSISVQLGVWTLRLPKKHLRREQEAKVRKQENINIYDLRRGERN